MSHTLNVTVTMHGERHSIACDADAVLASDWASDNKQLIRHGDNATSDAAAVDRDANIGDARRLANAAAGALVQRQSSGWKDRALHAKMALRFIRKVR
jgi:hypothetical protein